MSHFAEVDPNTNLVLRVIVAEQDFIDSGAVGEPSRWVQTSYNTRQGLHYGEVVNSDYDPNDEDSGPRARYMPDGGTPLRGNYAGIGYEYHSNIDAFIPPKANSEWNSWTVNTSIYVYEAPNPVPTDANTANGEFYEWNEDVYLANNSGGWIKVYR